MDDDRLTWLLGLGAVGLAVYYLWPTAPVTREAPPVFNEPTNNGFSALPPVRNMPRTYNPIPPGTRIGPFGE